MGLPRFDDALSHPQKYGMSVFFFEEVEKNNNNKKEKQRPKQF